jgi:uncharacterized protein with von Willebrand factor type A (vWA) domain
VSFLDEWLKRGGKHPSKLGRNSVQADRWDFRRFEEMLEEMRPFEADRRALCEVATTTGNGLWADAFFAFNKVDPKLADPDSMQARYLINRAVMEQAQKLPEWLRLRHWTTGDAVGAAGACIAMRPDLEQLYDRTKTAQERAEELQEKMAQLAAAQQEQRDLDDLVKDWTEANDPEAEENQEQAADYQNQQQLIEEQIAQMQADAEATAAGLDQELEGQAGGMRAILKSAMGRAADEAEALAATARMWGLEPGQLMRMPAAERLKLAKRTNTEEFRRMADVFGPMERLMAAEQQRRVIDVPEEVYDVGLGNDLERVLPSRLATLGHPVLRLEFAKDFAERRLPVYEMRGHESVARGGIVFCMDNSGSMAGDRELWAKAVGLCLLHLAKQQGRSFWGIHFGSQHEIREFDFSRDREHSVQDVIDFAEFFYNGGTNFVRPLSLALDHLRTEFDHDGAVDADIVFATDGQCGVPEHWKQTFLAEMERIDAKMWGISIGGSRQDQPMFDLCEGRVATIADVLTSTGDDIREIFAGV